MTQKTHGSTKGSTGKFCFLLLLFIHGNRPDHLQCSGPLLAHQTLTFSLTVVACDIPKGNRQLVPFLVAGKWKGYSHRKGSHVLWALILSQIVLL